jgi:MYXO-CTERM domain-containing protein
MRLALAWLLVVALPSAASAQTLELVRVTTRDGTELATDVWRPDGDASARPVLLRRTPYGRALDVALVRGLHAAGYTVVSQDVRGRGDSDGVFSPFRNDARDGADTIAWVAAQPWSNGRVGTFGGSAEGIVQLLAAGEGPEALRCVHALVATDDVHEGLYPGGAWRTELGTAWLEQLGEPEALVEFRAHEAQDAFWDPARLDAAERQRIRAEVFLVGGFFDIFASGTPRAFRQLAATTPAEPRGGPFLVLGPWTHGGLGTAQQGEVAYPADAAYQAYVTDLAAYFDWCLRDGPRPSFPPVRYYVTRLGEDGRTATGEWRDAAGWPPPSAPVELRLQPDGSLRGAAPPVDGLPVRLAVDPADPVSSLGGGNLTTAAGPHDQSAIDARPDVLVATTPTATETVELIGDLRARIYGQSATTDVDVVVRLEQLTPSGRAMLLADGIRRGRFVGGLDAVRPLVANEPALFDVDLGPIAIVLPPGHALRVALAGTSSPRYEPSPNVAEPIATARPRPTTLTIFREASLPSAIVLPVTRGTPPGASEPVRLDAGVPVDGGPARSTGGCGCRVGAPTPTPVALLALLALVVWRRGRR